MTRAQKPGVCQTPGFLPKKEALVLACILVVACAVRFARLDLVPPGVRYDELMNLRMANRVLAGERPIYFQESWGHEPLYHYLQAASLAVFGQTALGLRAISALSGALSVLTTYLVARRLFGPLVASIASALLALSFWSLMLSRFGLRIGSIAPGAGLAAYAFWRGLESPTGKSCRASAWFFFCGLCQATMLYTYFAGWMVPALLGAFVLYLALFHRSMLKGRWIGLSLCFCVPLLLIAPMIAFVVQHPAIGQRVGQVGSKVSDALRSRDFGPLLDNAWRTLLMFSFRGDKEWLYNIRLRPVFDPMTSVLFYRGILLALRYWRKPRYLFCILWLVAGLVPTMFTWPAGSLPHSVVALPATFVLLGLAIAAVYRWAIIHRPNAQAQTAPKPLRWLAMAATTASFVFFVGRDSIDYFARWPSSPHVQAEYQAPIAAAARYLHQGSDLSPVSISAPYVDYWAPWSKESFELLFRRGDVPVRWFDGTRSILFPAGSPTRFVLPDYADPAQRLDADLFALLAAGSERLDGEPGPPDVALDVYRFYDRTELDRFMASCAGPVWASPEGSYQENSSESQRRPLAYPLHVGDRLSFLGYRYDLEQIAPGGVWRMMTCWRVSGSNGDPLAIFVHLLDDTNTVRASSDELGVSTANWQKGDTLIHIHLLPIPADLVGIQRIEVGVYSPVTLERLPIWAESGKEAAPHDRVLLRPLDVR